MLLITTTPEIKSVVLKDKNERSSKSLFNFSDLLTSFFIDILGDIVIDALTIAFLPTGIGSIIVRTGAKFVKNVVTDFVRTGKIDWTNTFVNLGFDLLLVGSSFAAKAILNTSKRLAKTSKLAKVFYNTYTTGKKGLDFVKKSVLEKISEAAKEILEPIQKSAVISQKMKTLLQPQRINFLLKQGKEIYQAIKNPLGIITKGISKLKQFTNDKIKKVIERQGLKFWTSIAQKQAINGKITNKLAEKYTKALAKVQKGQIYFNSSWISGVRVYNPKYWEQTRFISFFLYFKREATTTKNAPKGKRPLELVMPINKYFDFINSASKGRYYLENIAWGWILGKGKRILNNITFNSFNDLYNSKDFERFRFQIHKVENHKEALLNDFENINKVKKHRTNKTQKVAFAERLENGKIKISFEKNVKDINSNIYTKQTVYKKQKRK